jgi:D-3-phosphoglycerate dehydrogenase
MPKHTFVIARGNLSDTDVEREHLAGQPVEVRLASLTSPEDVSRETADADGIIVTTNPLPRQLIDALAPGVRIIGRAGIGLDAIDLEAARRRKIAVFHYPDYATDEVATHTVAMILALNRRLVEGNAIGHGDWSVWRKLTPMAPLHEQTVGVLGCGRIGRAVIERLKPLAGQILAFDPYASCAMEGVSGAASLGDLLARSDILTLHVPLTEETQELIGERELNLLRKGALLVNVSRGRLVDEEALARALTYGHLAGAALDVLVNEPPLTDAAILRAPNVLITPHVAWYSDSSERRMRTATVDGMLSYLEDRPLQAGRFAVDPRREA